MKSFTYTDLDKLTGEVLPERAVLSTLLTGGGHGHGHGGTTAVVPLCQSTVSNQSGILWLVGASNNSSFTCAGAVVVSGH